MSLVIRNGRVFMEGKLLRKNVLIEDSVISKISSKPVSGERALDARGKVILPGIIDPHVHFREPGMEYKEDFRTGSVAAAAGGVTCVLDMPNNKPPILTVRDLEKKRELAKKSVVDYGFHFGSSEDNIPEIVKAENIASVKIFMNTSTGNMLIEKAEVLKKIMSASKINAVHAEGEKAGEAIGTAERLGKKVYICHVSRETGLEQIRENRKRNAFAEVTPHHLFLTEKDQNEMVKMKPVLGKDSDRRSLWEALNDGTIDTIGSDHAPHTMEEKRSSEVFGVPGVETRLPLMLDAVSRGLITLGRMVETMCENPAKIFKTEKKGSIREGNDGDLTIVDMKMRKRVRNDGLFTKCGWSPFEGRELKGWPTRTISRGRVIFEDGEVERGKGREVEIHG